jgi:glucose-1-phosphate thymidylyltransferase
MRAIIPVAGMGKRLRPHTHTLPKVLVHVAGKPMLGHLLDELKNLGIDAVTLIVGYRGDRVVEYVEQNYDFDATFVEQKEMLGLGHAISLAKDNQKGDEPGLIVLGDTIFSADLASVIERGISALGVKEVEDARRFGVIEKNDGGDITKLVEKADVPPSNLAIVGIYYLNDMPLLFEKLDYIINNDIKTKGEFQLTDALQAMLEDGHQMKFFEIDGWHDCGKKETLLSTNRELLESRQHLQTSSCAKLEDSILRQPVYLHPSVVVKNSIIGPNVSAGPGCEITHSIVSESILSAEVEVRNINLTESVLADRAVAAGQPRVLNIGEDCEMSLGSE